MNTFGNIFRLTTFGESHGEAIGGVIDGMPAGIPIDLEFIQRNWTGASQDRVLSPHPGKKQTRWNC